MPRERKFWRKAGRPWFYTKIDGVQTRLEKTEAASRRTLEQLLRGQKMAADPNGLTFAKLADKFLLRSRDANEPETFEVHRLFLQTFVDHVGNRKLIAKLCKADLDEWCQKHAKGFGVVRCRDARGEKGRTRPAKPWSENTQVRARAIVLATLNYGTKDLNLPQHPLAHVRPGTVTARERYLTPEERQTIRSTVAGPFADYVFALENTGARPFSEVAKITAADVDLKEATWTLAKWKNARKQKGKKRVIYLTDNMLQLTRKLVVKYPEGELFRNSLGDTWTRQTLTARFRNLSKRLGFPVSAYNVRTAYITDALARGVPVAVVAELCGTSIQTIQKHYAKMDKKHDVLREAARRAVGA